MKLGKDHKIFNGTPHAINIVVDALFDATIRKFVGGTVISSLPSNGLLSASIKTVLMGTVEGGIPVYNKEFTGVDDLPEGYDIYIVSALFATAYRKTGSDMKRIFTVADPVYSPDGQSFVGCKGICPAF